MDTNAPAFRPVLSGLLQLLQKVFLPHLAAALGLWLVTFFVFARAWDAAASLVALKVAAEVVFGVVSGGVLFVYGFLAACMCAVRIGSASWEDFLDAQFTRVEAAVLAKAGNADRDMPKSEAEALVAGSVQDTLAPLKQKGPLLAVWSAAVLLGLMRMALRSVLVRQMAKMSGTTLRMSRLFAGKATLAGAVLLNLHFLAIVAQIGLYMAGLLLLAADFAVLARL